jgi:hypothetical protein
MLAVTQLGKKLVTFYGDQKFILVLKIVHVETVHECSVSENPRV